MDETAPSPSPGVPAAHRSSPAPTTAGSKRKRGTGNKFYAVKAGFQPGIYTEWKECLAQITGYKGAIFQAFTTTEEANAFLTGSKLPSASGSGTDSGEKTRYYGVQRGIVPGVYTDWAKAQEQIRGVKGPRYKKFSTREEAELFVSLGQRTGTSTSSSAAAAAAGMSSAVPTSTLPADFAPPGLMIENPKDENGIDIEPGTGPLPPGAEDGFDPNIILDPRTGKILYKTTAQKTATKLRPKDTPGMLRIYTDGSSLKNGSQVASAGVGVYFGPGDEKNVSEPLKGTRQTNQRAELTAILRAIEIAPRHRDVTIVTDSQYAIKCVTEWFVSWRRKNWMTSDNKPVENRDLVESILGRIEERNELDVKTRFEWVKGHSREPGNEAADRLAVNGARQGASEKSAALEVMRDVPEDVFDDDDVDDF